MSGHLDGTYGVVSVKNSDAAYFMEASEVEPLSRFLDGRDSQSSEDRAEFVLIRELSGESMRVAIDTIEYVKISTPESRQIIDEIGRELKARRIADPD